MVPAARMAEKIKREGRGARILVVALFSLACFVENSVWTSFNDVANLSAAYWNVPVSQVDWLPASFSLAYLLLFAPLMWYLQSFGDGVRSATLTSGVLFSLGCALRVAGWHLRIFRFAMYGQLMCAAGRVTQLMLPSEISARFFRPAERTLATAVPLLVSQLGAAAGLVVPAFFATSDGMSSVLMLQFLMAAAVTTAMVAYFPSHPATGWGPPAQDKGMVRTLCTFPCLACL